MYKKFTLSALFIAFVMAVSCSSKKEDHQELQSMDDTTKADSWNEMDEFHTLMAEAFHPYKDSANLEPAKANAEEMATMAGKWAGSALPEKVNNDEVKAKLQKLQTDTEAFSATVKTGNDEAIGESLNQLHDLFHEIQESWYDSDGHHHHHH